MFERSTILKKLNSPFRPQLIVIGGGITGAGIFLDAQSRGIDTLLVEMDDFGAGTSSKSTKLIHGGLRYLKQLHFKVVKETGRERSIVKHIAPHLTHEIKVRLPIQKGGSLGSITTKLALTAYEYLADVNDEDKHSFYTAKELVEEDSLKEKGLKGAYDYLEYKTDDARLVIENIKKGVEIGGTAINKMKVTGFSYNSKGIINGVNLKDQISQEEYSLNCEHVISASGPWVDELCKIEDATKPDKLILTKGVHLVFKKEALPINNTYYFDTDDGRMMFVIPHRDVVYLGTTDTIYTQDKSAIRTTKADVDYLIKNVNSRFDIQLSSEQIISSWAGVRPLIHQKGKGPSEISRKDEIFVSDSGLYSIAGGKLTGYRIMAKKILDHMIRSRHMIAEPCFTDQIQLCGGQFAKDEFMKRLKGAQIKGLELGIDESRVANLFHKFGKNTFKILNNINMFSKEFSSYSSNPCLLGALHYCLEKEFVTTPLDFAIRRMALLYFEPELLENSKEDILNYMNSYFSWTPEQLEQHTKDLETEMFHSKNFA